MFGSSPFAPQLEPKTGLAQRRGYVNLAKSNNYHHTNSGGKQIRGFQGGFVVEAIRRPYLRMLSIHKRSDGDTDLKIRTLSARHGHSAGEARAALACGPVA
jgi:hypothetical protein